MHSSSQAKPGCLCDIATCCYCQQIMPVLSCSYVSYTKAMILTLQGVFSQAGQHTHKDNSILMHGMCLSVHAHCMQYGYRMSKTALNMAGKLLAEDLSQHNIPVAIVHPGPVSISSATSLCPKMSLGSVAVASQM